MASGEIILCGRGWDGNGSGTRGWPGGGLDICGGVMLAYTHFPSPRVQTVAGVVLNKLYFPFYKCIKRAYRKTVRRRTIIIRARVYMARTKGH